MVKKKYGYKGFNIDEQGNLYCRDKYFKVGEIAEQEGELKLCENGLHFCWDLKNVNGYYTFNGDDVVICKVEILGDVIDGYNKSVTNKLKIVEVYKKEKLRELANIGKENVGYLNIGDYNTGHRNTGHRNTGDYNSCNYSNGFFNTIDPKINLFNKPTNYTTKEFKQTEWYDALTNGRFTLTEWVNYTEEEKVQDKQKELIGGYLKEYTYEEACANWWKSLNEENRAIIQTMPNFDKDIFKEITGIEV